MSEPGQAVVRRLIEARALIADPAHWTQGKGARTSDGRPTDALGPDAYRWCAAGALYKVTGGDKAAYRGVMLALERVAPADENVADFNDTHSHAEVLAAFDRAIADATGVPA